MQGTKHPGESFRDYFRRAKHDAGVRRQMLESSRKARSVAGWAAVVFAVLVAWITVSLGISAGRWVSTRSIACAIFFVMTMMVYSKFGERIAALEAMDRAGDSKP
jgi:hypothetical protein